MGTRYQIISNGRLNKIKNITRSCNELKESVDEVKRYVHSNTLTF